MSDFETDSLILGGADSRGSEASASSSYGLLGMTFADGPVAAPDSPPMASAGSDQHTNPMVTISQLQATLATKLNMYRGNLTTEMLWTAFWPQQSHEAAMLQSKDYDNLILTYSVKITAVDTLVSQCVATDTASVADTAAVTAPVRGDSSNREVRSEPRGPAPSPTQGPLKRKQNRIRLTLEARPQEFCDPRIPDREHFKSFLADHIRNHPNKAMQWNKKKLNDAYADAHTSHIRYSCWIGTQDANGRYDHGAICDAPTQTFLTRLPFDTGIKH